MRRLRTRGGFEAYRRDLRGRIASFTRTAAAFGLRTLSPEALAVQARFFDCFLKGVDNGMRDDARVGFEGARVTREIHDVRSASAWPLPARVDEAPTSLRERSETRLP